MSKIQLGRPKRSPYRSVGLGMGGMGVSSDSLIASGNRRISGSAATRAMLPGFQKHARRYGTVALRPRGKSGGIIAAGVRKRHMHKEDVQAILDLRTMFAEADDQEALLSEFIENGVTAEEIDEILRLTEEDIAEIEHVASTEDDVESETLPDPIYLEEDPALTGEIMQAIINERPADVQELFKQAILGRLNNEIDRWKHDLYGEPVEEESRYNALQTALANNRGMGGAYAAAAVAGGLATPSPKHAALGAALGVGGVAALHLNSIRKSYRAARKVKDEESTN